MTAPRHILIAAAAALALCGHAQQPEEPFALTAEKCFVEAPAEVVKLIDRNTRLDMLDYYKAGINRRVPITELSSARIDTITEQSIVIDLNESGATVQIFVLNPQEPKPIIAVVETLPIRMADSAISAYSTTWQPIEGIAPSPGLSDWLASKEQRAEAQEMLPFITAKAAIEPVGTLVLTPTISEYFFGPDRPKAQALLKPELRYGWDGRRYKKI